MDHPSQIDKSVGDSEEHNTTEGSLPKDTKDSTSKDCSQKNNSAKCSDLLESLPRSPTTAIDEQAVAAIENPGLLYPASACEWCTDPVFPVYYQVSSHQFACAKHTLQCVFCHSVWLINHEKIQNIVNQHSWDKHTCALILQECDRYSKFFSF
jgi:hypothetical protein